MLEREGVKVPRRVGRDGGRRPRCYPRGRARRPRWARGTWGITEALRTSLLSVKHHECGATSAKLNNNGSLNGPGWQRGGLEPCCLRAVGWKLSRAGYNSGADTRSLACDAVLSCCRGRRAKSEPFVAAESTSQGSVHAARRRQQATRSREQFDAPTLALVPTCGSCER